MNMDAANKWLTLAANVGVLAGIVFLGFELQQSSRIAIADQTRGRTEVGVAINSQIIENSEIWEKGNSNKELNSQEQIIYDQILASLWSRAFTTSSARALLGGAELVGVHDFSWFLYHNPGARQRWLEIMEQEQKGRQLLIPVPVGADLMNVILSDLEKLDSENGL